MSAKIIFQNGVFEVQKELFVSKSTVNEDQLVRELRDMNDTPILLPLGIRWFMKIHSKLLALVVEEPPTVRTMRWWDPPVILDRTRFGSQLRSFRLATPYVIWLMYIAMTKDGYTCRYRPDLFYSSQPFSDPDTRLRVTNLSNVHTCGTVCLGKLIDDLITRPCPSLNVLVHTICSRFWNSEFGYDDYNANSSGYHWELNPLRLEEWQKLTTEDPRQILRINWVISDKKISENVRVIRDRHTYGYTTRVIDLATRLPQIINRGN